MSTKKIMLKSTDGQTFELEEAVAMESETIKHLMDVVDVDVVENKSIPLPNVTGIILAKVIEYCKKHVEGTVSGDWDKDFVKVDQSTLFDIILAANYLNIKGLLDLTCQTVADMIKGKTPEQLREYFNIKDDLTPEEEEEVRRENQWAFE